MAASLAYLILRQQDAAGLVTFSDHIEAFIPPKAKRDYLLQILHALENRGPAGETNVGRILEEIAGQIKRRGLVVLVSDLLDEPEKILKGLRLFRFKGNDVIVFHLLDPAELSLPFDGNILFEDLEELNLRVVADPRAIRKTYREVVEEFTSRMRQECHDNVIDYQLISTSTLRPSAGELSELEGLSRACRFFFCTPFTLFGLAAASLPILIHLLNRRKLKRIRFPAVRFILLSQKRISRSYRLRHWLLLALRTLAVVFLASASRQPDFSDGRRPSPAAARFHWSSCWTTPSA